MPFVPALNTARVSIDYLSTHGEKATNVIHVRNMTGAYDATRLASLINIIEAWLGTHWDLVASNQWQTDLITAQDISTADSFIVNEVVTINGAAADPSLPAQNTIAVSLRTGKTGRSRRGRLFHVGLSEAMVVGSTLGVAFVNQIISVYNELRLALIDEGFRWVVASFVSEGAPRATALLSDITSIIMTDAVVDSMDTRKPD